MSARPLTIMLVKGRPLEAARGLLERAGLAIEDDALNGRQLLFADREGRAQFAIVKSVDVPVYVERGAADIGILGREVLLESPVDVYRPLTLPIGRCRLSLCAPEGTPPDFFRSRATVRIATKFPRVTREWFGARGVSVDVMMLESSVELAPRMGLADAIVDLVETGRTLRENGLVVLTELADIACEVIVNRAAYHLRPDVQPLLDRLSEATSC